MCSICCMTTLCLNNRAAMPLHAADKSPQEDLLHSGNSQRTVAAHFNVSQSVISRLWNRFQLTGAVAERLCSGRPRFTTTRQDRYLVNMANRQRFQSAVRLNTGFQTATRVRVTPQTVCNRLHAANLRAFLPAVRPNLIPRHRTARLQWARNHANWQLRHWTPVLFTDESRFSLDFHDIRRRVWRTTDERYANLLCC
jgi:transposase